jgi:hypothetical protein
MKNRKEHRMFKERRSMFDRFKDELTVWFEDEKITMEEAKDRLAKLGCPCNTGSLYGWWRKQRAKALRETMLEQISQAAEQCAAVEAAFDKNPPPAVVTLINLHRVLVLKLSNEANGLTPAMVHLATSALRPLLDWQQLEDKRRELELEEKEEKLAAEEKAATNEGGLRPETLEKIERELGLG